MKKCISILLSLVMVLTMVPMLSISSFAAVDTSNGEALAKKIGQANAEKLIRIYEGEDVDDSELYSILGDESFDVTTGKDIYSGSSSTYMLVDNTTYTFKANVTFTAGLCQSAMKVEPGAKVFLCIPKGITVTVKGGDADGGNGAGAGIEVPADATLVIKGEGTLNVTGGAGGAGTNGTNALPGAFDADDGGRMYTGDGGNGGNGGGGAGAGIGGAGGNGGTGGKGGTFEGRDDYTLDDHPAVWTDGDDADKNGGDGADGTSGTLGTDCGKVLILGGVTVNATAGAAGKNGNNGADSKEVDDTGSGFTRNYYAGSSGGGGGGQGGLRPLYGIGGGGQGGSGGGGGGTGGTRCLGGCLNGATGGTCGQGRRSGKSIGDDVGGSGGSSANTGLAGNSGTVYIDKDAKVTGRPCFYYDATLEQAADMIVSIGEAPLVVGDITKVNGYQNKPYEKLALALFEAITHDGLNGYTINVPQSGVQKQRNGAFRYTDSGDWYKEFVDTCGGYVYLVLDMFQECAVDDFKYCYQEDNDYSNPYYFVERTFGTVSAAKGNAGMDIYGTTVLKSKMLTLLHTLFFDDHYCEPDGGNRNSPGYTKTNRTDGTHSYKDNALRVIHNTYINMKESNTNRTLTLMYDTARDHTAFNFHYYYHFNSALVVMHDKKDGINGSNWMKYLPQDMPITEVNMPGSHDAGLYSTNHVWPFMFIAQSLSITDQLKAGARYLDIRVDAMENDLWVYHGSARGRDTRDDSVLTFDKVLDMCDEFLAENPDQFIIIQYNAEARTMDKDPEKTLFEQFCKKNNIVNYYQNGVNAEQATGGNVDTSKTRHYLINLQTDADNRGKIIVPSVGFSKNTVYFVFAHDVDKWEDHYSEVSKTKTKWLDLAFSASPKQITTKAELKWSDWGDYGPDDPNNTIEALKEGKTTVDTIVLDNPKIVFASTYESFYDSPFAIPNPIAAGKEVNEWINDYSFKEGLHYGYILLNDVNPYTCSRIYLSNTFQRDKLYGGDYDGDGVDDEKILVVGSNFSSGIIWIVVAVVVLAAAGSVIFVKKNKKKAEKPVEEAKEE